jgi:cytochrome b
MTVWDVLERLLDRGSDPEAGMTTAELLGNAALGVLALVVIWGLLQSLGVDIVNWMRNQLL